MYRNDPKLAGAHKAGGQDKVLFVRYHASLRVRLPGPIPTRGNGSPKNKKWKQHTPTMAAGVIDHSWTIKELLMCHTANKDLLARDPPSSVGFISIVEEHYLL